MSIVRGYHELIVLRIFVGVMESGFAPGVLLIISSWYKRSEQSRRFAVFMSAAILSGAFGGLLAGAITGGLEGAHGIRGWRWLFIVEGAATAGWAIVSAFLLLDFPANSKRLTDRERAIAIARLQEDSVTVRGEGEKIGKAKSFMLALRDWRTWAFILGYMVRFFSTLPTCCCCLSKLIFACFLGHCRLINPVLFLPDSCRWPWLQQHRSGTIHDGKKDPHVFAGNTARLTDPFDPRSPFTAWLLSAPLSPVSSPTKSRLTVDSSSSHGLLSP